MFACYIVNHSTSNSKLVNDSLSNQLWDIRSSVNVNGKETVHLPVIPLRVRSFEFKQKLWTNNIDWLRSERARFIFILIFFLHKSIINIAYEYFCIETSIFIAKLIDWLSVEQTGSGSQHSYSTKYDKKRFNKVKLLSETLWLLRSLHLYSR